MLHCRVHYMIIYKCNGNAVFLLRYDYFGFWMDE